MTPRPTGTREVGLVMTDRSAVAQIAWLDASARTMTKAVGPACRDVAFERALPWRKAHNYPQRRNYEGLYWCAGTQAHVWYESMTERSSLMFLDHTQLITAIAAQPMRIVFADGGWHVPDYFALIGARTRVLYDVKPQELIDSDVQTQIDKTAVVCAQIGWKYQVLHDLPLVFGQNLEWLAGFRHPWNAMPDDQRLRLLIELRQPCTLARALSSLSPEAPVRSQIGRAHV